MPEPVHSRATNPKSRLLWAGRKILVDVMKPHILHETRRIIKFGYLVSTVFYQSSIKICTHIKITKATFPSGEDWTLSTSINRSPSQIHTIMTDDGCLDSLERINSQEQKEPKLWKNQLWKLKSI